MLIPFLDLKRQFVELEAEVTAAAMRVLSGGMYVLGPEVEAFEKEWAEFCGVAGAAAVACGTNALTLALIASGTVRKNQGDEVITSPLTSPYTALSIISAGAVPVFVDIDPLSFTLQPEEIEKAITPRTRAIVPVHLYGQLADMLTISEIAARRKLIVIEDASHSHGAKFTNKSAGHSLAAAYSFYPTKNLGAYGDGGVITSKDETFIKTIKSLRQGGHNAALHGKMEGLNSRLDEFQAAILRVKLKRLNEWNERRRRAAMMYSAALQACPQIRVPAVVEPLAHVHHLYVIQHEKRDCLQKHLFARGVETLVHYPLLLHQQSLFRRPSQKPLPIAEHLVNDILSLPLYPQLEDMEIVKVIEAVVGFEE
ncbi:MAG: DegT/DnrJ/EryC1/StrS family aminotransferase [Pyrinomonadaceae bacterium]